MREEKETMELKMAADFSTSHLFSLFYLFHSVVFRHKAILLVAISPEITSKNFSREILDKLVQDHKAYLGK